MWTAQYSLYRARDLQIKAETRAATEVIQEPGASESTTFWPWGVTLPDL